jgi:hypothetical protein
LWKEGDKGQEKPRIQGKEELRAGSVERKEEFGGRRS